MTKLLSVNVHQSSTNHGLAKTFSYDMWSLWIYKSTKLWICAFNIWNLILNFCKSEYILVAWWHPQLAASTTVHVQQSLFCGQIHRLGAVQHQIWRQCAQHNVSLFYLVSEALFDHYRLTFNWMLSLKINPC